MAWLIAGKKFVHVDDFDGFGKLITDKFLFWIRFENGSCSPLSIQFRLFRTIIWVIEYLLCF